MSSKIVSIEDISEKVTKGTTPTTLGYDFVESGIRLLRAQNVDSKLIFTDEDLFIDEDTHEKLGRSIIIPNDVLLTIAGTIGRTTVVPENCEPLNCNQAVAIIRPKCHSVYPNYLRYWLNSQSAVSQIQGSKVTATISNLSLTQIKKLKIPLPPLEEQKRIAAILDKADQLRQQRQRAIARLDDLLQSVFLDMFGDPVTNPMGWEVGKIGDLAEHVNYGTSKKADPDGNIPYLRMGNITYSGKWDFSDMKYIDLDEEEKKKYLVHQGQILFNRTNSKELVGKTAVYREKQPMAFAGYLVRMITNDRANPEYVSAFMNTPQIKQFLAEKCKSIVGMANINAQEFQKINIPIPPITKQNEFAAIVMKILERLESYNQQNQVSNNLFSSLQQRAFRGEL